jgi:hypothetical protein
MALGVPWSVEETRRRLTVSLYAKLFTLKQQFDGAIIDVPVELVWGVGIATSKSAGNQAVYPLITHLVEIVSQ